MVSCHKPKVVRDQTTINFGPILLLPGGMISESLVGIDTFSDISLINAILIYNRKWGA